MKTLFTFLMAFILAICSFAFVAEAKPAISVSINHDMKILLICNASVGAAAMAKFVRTSDAVIVVGDNDGILVEGPLAPIIANKNGCHSMATVKPDRLVTQSKTDAPKSDGIKTRETFYDLPPNDYGFSGQSYSNPIRAQPS